MDLSKQKLYSIGEAARIIGVSITTLRRWDREGKISVGRTPSGNRVFSEFDLLLLKKTFRPNSVKSDAPKFQKPSFLNFKFISVSLIILLLVLNVLNFNTQSKAVLGIETFVAPALEEGGPIGNVLSLGGKFIGGLTNIFKGGTFVVPLLGRSDLATDSNLKVAGNANIAKDIEGLGNLRIKGEARVGKLITPIIDPYLIENDGTIQSTLTIRSVGDISLEPGTSGIGNVTISGVVINNSSLSSVNNITSQGTITTNNIITTSDTSIGGNLTLTGKINGDTLSSTSLVFSGSNPTIYPGTTNSSISLNSNGTGAINIGNSSKGDIYLGGGATSGTYCLITNSNGSLNCSGDITSQGNLYANSGSLKTTQTTAYLFNQTATTLNIGGAATTINLGSSTGSTTIGTALTLGSTLGVTGASTFTGNSTFAGRPTFTKAPSLAHTGAWSIGSSSWNISDATVYINPATIGAADNNLLGIAVNGSVKFAVDSEGDTYVNNLILAGNITSATTTVSGDLNVEGNTTLGDATTDTFTVNPATITLAGGDKTIDITGAATRTLTILNSTSAQVTDLDLSDGSLKTGGTSRLTNAGVLQNITGLTVSSGSVSLPSSSVAVASLTPGTAGQLLISSITPTATWTTLSSDATISSTGALTLANTAVTAGAYGSTTAVPVITVDSKGRLTGVTTAAISSAWSSLTAPTTDLTLTMAGYQSTFNFSGTTGTQQTLGTTDSAATGTTTVNSLGVNLTGTDNASGANTVNGINFATVTPKTNNTFNAINLGTGYNNIIVSGNVTLTAAGALTVTSLTVNGTISSTSTVTGTQLISTVATGTAPLSVTSTTVVPNLNSSQLQGYAASDLYNTDQPNLVLNSDFGRRNKWMTFMPETFTDTAGWTAQTGSLGTVSGNLLTPGSASGTAPALVWRATAGLSTWRDVRISAQYQLTANESLNVSVEKYADSSNYVEFFYNRNSTALYLQKIIGGVTTFVDGAGYTGTVNDFYWLELESQGTFYIGKFYSCPVTATACAKSSATLVATYKGTIADAGVAAGKVALKTQVAVGSVTTAPKFGGLSTGDGGVYVEGWGPESWTPTYCGTIGGQAIGFDETADAGPLSKQYAMRYYIPASSRCMYLTAGGMPDGSVNFSTAYTASMYLKTSGKTGTDPLIEAKFIEADSGGGNQVIHRLTDAGETDWLTRKTSSFTSASTTRHVILQIIANINLSDLLGNAAGTGWIDLPQLEQGSVATPWRNAPADDGPIEWVLARTATNIAFTSATFIELDPNVLSSNVFLPWDGKIDVDIAAGARSSGAGNNFVLQETMDGSQIQGSGYGNSFVTAPVANYNYNMAHHIAVTAAAGKHRIAQLAKVDAGTTTIDVANVGFFLTITATRGKFDLAEEYTVSDETIEAGDVVRLIKNEELGIKNSTLVGKTDKGYDSSILGIISTDPGITLSSTVELNSYQNKPNLRPVALSGRVPVKVTNENGDIHRGDTLTSSDKYPGYAMKATKAGRSIGVAMEDFAPQSNPSGSSGSPLPPEVSTGKIMTFVNLSFYDPQVYLTDTGDFVINKVTEQPIQTLVDNGTGTVEIKDNTSSTNNNNTTYSLTNSTTKEIIDRVGGYNNLFVANLKVGSLDVSNITSDQIKALELRIKNLELSTTSASLNSTSSAVLSASVSALLTNDNISSSVYTESSTRSAVLSSLTVTGRTLLNDLGITGTITNGLLSIDGLSSSINSLTDIKLKTPGGQITIDKDGNLIVQNSLSAKTIEGKEYVVSGDAIGQGTIAAGQTQTDINSGIVTPISKIFVTPITKTNKQALSVTNLTVGKFTVIIEESVNFDIKFNYWVVNSK